MIETVRQPVMITRRSMAIGLVAIPAILRMPPSLAQQAEDGKAWEQLIYPPFGAIGAPDVFGYDKPTQAQRQKVKEIIASTPKGPSPLAIAQSFIERFAKNDPMAISQWPAPASWNPLIVQFFNDATASPVNNDMVAWCAAFANWCIERNNKTGTRSAASQSFTDPKNAAHFKKVSNPEPGDLAVWTCYNASTGTSLGLGHVAFVTGKPTNTSVPTISGNTSDDNHSSIIAEKPFSTRDRQVYRTINGSRVLSVMKLNSYLKIV